MNIWLDFDAVDGKKRHLVIRNTPDGVVFTLYDDDKHTALGEHVVPKNVMGARLLAAWLTPPEPTLRNDLAPPLRKAKT